MGKEQMYKVLLVDDEYFPREALKKTILWEEYDCMICGEANNGVDGLEKALLLKPDIVLADINMPVMGGLDMIMSIKKSLPDVLFSIVTGYSEFEDAKRGIELGVEHFILKPVDDAELIRTVQHMVGILEERRKKEQEYSSLKFWAEKNADENRKNFLGMLLTGESDISENRFYYECDQLDVPMKTGGYGVCCLKVDSRSYIHYSQMEWQSKMEEILGNIGVTWNYAVCYLGKGDLYVIFNGLREEEWDLDIVNSIVQKIQIAFMQKWVCTIKAGVGNYCPTYREIARERREAEAEVHEIVVSKLVTQMLHYIYENYDDPDFSLKKVSEQLYVNYSYLSAQFTKEMGMSASQYVTRFRMQKAADELRNGQENMIEVACSVGYTDVKYFYRCFKREFGITPYQYVDIIRKTVDKRDEM